MALRQKLNEAINDCNFIEAKKLSIQMQQLAENTKNQMDWTQQTKNRNNFEATKSKLQLDAAHNFSDSQNLIKEQRDLYEQKILSINTNYEKRMAEINEEHTREVELCMSRHVPEADVKVREAQQLAKFRDFDSAYAVYNESEAVRQKTTQERQGQCIKQYQSTIDKMRQQQQNEIDVATRTLQKELFRIKTKYDKNISNYTKYLKAAAFKYSITLEDGDENVFQPLEISELANYEPSLSATSTPPSSAPTSPKSFSPMSPKTRSRPSTPSLLK